MADLLQSGISALLSSRAALDTAGHNIANVNTPGYSRQRVELASRLGAPQGDGYIGSGVQIETVRRVSNQFIGARILTDTSAFSRADSFENMARSLDLTLSDASTGLSRPMSDFFDSLNQLTADPSSTTNRQVVINEANDLATRFHSLQGQIDNLQTELNARIRQDVVDINAASSSIAQLNERIAIARADAGGQPPNDLLDQRDSAVADLASKIGISTTLTSDGQLNVYTGNGQSLVLGKDSFDLSVANSEFGPEQLEVSYSGVPVTRQVGSGSLGGLLDAQREVLDPARSRLGRLAVAVTEAFNTQHALGEDQLGQAGGDFFAPLSASGQPSSNNSGSGTADISFSDVAAIRDVNYRLSYDGTNYSLTNAGTGAAIAFSGTGSLGNPITVDGLSIVTGGAPAAGDEFLIRPTANAAREVSVAISDPREIAAAAAGSGADSSDNSNAQAMLDLNAQGLLDGGQNSITEAQIALTSFVGNQAQQADVARTSHETLLNQALSARDSVSGVNLDEEASDLIRFQQAYQAAAQVIAVADTVFQSLIAAARG